jgi:hypothetical protein
MQAALVVKALLDSQAGKFMQSFAKERPLKYEFTPGRGMFVFAVNRITFDGKSTYIGEIQRLHRYPMTWLIATVAPRTFYGRDSGEALSTRQEQHPAKEDVGIFKSHKEAADKLWELYEHPGGAENV